MAEGQLFKQQRHNNEDEAKTTKNAKCILLIKKCKFLQFVEQMTLHLTIVYAFVVHGVNGIIFVVVIVVFC